MKRLVLLRVLLILLCTGITTLTFAQDRVITGIISDQAGVPLSGATVSVKGKKVSTTSTSAGTFRLTVPADATALVVSYVGMKEQEVTLSGSSAISVTLNVTETSMNEVVVIGYGSVKRANVSSAISSISEKDFKNLPVAGVDQALQGKLAGVSVNSNGGQPGGGVSVRVRGITSVSGSAEPLYVIDGVPLPASNSSLEQNALGGGSGSTSQSVIASLNMSDIASIDVLKDASAQAIYGSLGGNGVVLITTKKGRSGAGKITYDAYTAWQEIPKKLDVLNLREFAQYRNSLVPDVRAAGSGLDSVAEFRNPQDLGIGTDWQDEIYQRGYIQSHQLAFSGGHDKTSYYFSGGYFDQLGTLIETKFRRYNLRLSVDQQVKSWLRAGVSTNLSRSNQKIGLSDGFDAVTSVVLFNSPAAPVRDIYGNYISEQVIGGGNYGNPNNPVALARLRDVRAITTRVFGNLYADLDILKGLTLRNEFNYDFALRNNSAYQPYITNDSSKTIILSPSRLREERNNSLYWAFKTYFSYNRNFGVHAVSATVGHETQYSQYDYIQVTRDKLEGNLPSIGAGAGGDGSGEQIGAGADRWKMESYFVRAGYTLNNKYSITGTFRADGSSSFGPRKRWGYFPAGSASWTVTNEEFAKGIRHLSYLKLRVGVGSVGYQSISAQNPYSSNITLNPAGPLGPGGLPSNVENPFLSWQSVVTYNAGVDATVINRRLDLSVDVYKKVTTDMLLLSQLPAFSGLGPDWNDIKSPYVNDGHLTNTGIDISLTSYNIQKKDFTWKTNLVFTHFKNKLDYLNTPDALLNGEFNEYGTLNVVSVSRQGYPVGTFFGFVTDGLFRSMDELNNGTDWGLPVAPDKQWLGDIRYKDLNGDKVIDGKDVTEIGNPTPKFTYGITNSFTYKNFDLSLFLQGSYGGKIFNYARRQTEGLITPNNNQLKTVLNRYSSENPNGVLPRYNQWHNNNLRISDRFIEDGSYLRIQNISIGYNLPKHIINKARINGVRLYASVQNLKTFTDYSGYDPELGGLNNSVLLQNVDNGHYPNPRTFTIGANIEF